MLAAAAHHATNAPLYFLFGGIIVVMISVMMFDASCGSTPKDEDHEQK